MLPKGSSSRFPEFAPESIATPRASCARSCQHVLSVSADSAEGDSTASAAPAHVASPFPQKVHVYRHLKMRKTQTTTTTSVQYCPKVCIFDIDNTLTVGTDHDPQRCPVVVPGRQPAWPKNSGTTKAALDVVKACHDMGYKIAFTSAESKTEGDNDAQKRFIKSLDPTGGELFTDQFFQSPAYQNAWNVVAHGPAGDQDLEFGHKEAMFLNVLSHYDVPPVCFPFSIVFDDQTENLCAARGLNLRSVQASPECGGLYCTQGCGVEASAVEAIKRLA